MKPTKTGFRIGEMIELEQDPQYHGYWCLRGIHTGRLYTASIRTVDDLHEMAGQAVEAERTKVRHQN